MATQYRVYSPHLFVKNFKTPTLVTGGELDYRVPYTEDLSMFTSLQRMNVPSRLVIFPDEGHWIGKPQNQQLWWGEVQGWLKKYLEGKTEGVRACGVRRFGRRAACDVRRLATVVGLRAAVQAFARHGRRRPPLRLLVHRRFIRPSPLRVGERRHGTRSSLAGSGANFADDSGRDANADAADARRR